VSIFVHWALSIRLYPSGSDLTPATAGMKLANWIKRLGFWGFLFFLVKGLLWLLIPAVIAVLANS
jgi:hypothetical protein